VPLECGTVRPIALRRVLRGERALALVTRCRLLRNNALNCSLGVGECGGRGVFLLAPQVERRLRAEAEVGHG